MQKIPVIVQARTGSTRLPGKALLQLGGEPLLSRVLCNLGECRCIGPMVVAVPHNSVAALEPLARQAGAETVAGPEEDVLGRYAAVLEQFPCSHFVRATGDNPFVSAEMLDLAVAYHLEHDADLTHWLGIPLGCGVEVVRSSVLMRAAAEAELPHEREHVTPWIYSNREQFRVCEPELPFHPELRLTVDTADDFDRAGRILAALGNPRTVRLGELLSLQSRNPRLFD